MDAADPLSTQREGHFELTAELSAAGFENADEIGRGGFGVVYRCEQRVLERVVAVKVLAEGLEDENLERFLREQRAMGKLSGHPNIVNIFQVGATASGRPYIVMQYHSHGSLDARSTETGRSPGRSPCTSGSGSPVRSRPPTSATCCTVT